MCGSVSVITIYLQRPGGHLRVYAFVPPSNFSHNTLFPVAIQDYPDTTGTLPRPVL